MDIFYLPRIGAGLPGTTNNGNDTIPDGGAAAAARPQLLAGKVAIVTGGVTGIGRAIAAAFLEQGARVCVNHLPDRVSAASFHGLLMSSWGREVLINCPGDVSRPDAAVELVRRTVDRWGRVDVLVSNAGVCQPHDFLSLPPELLTSTVGTNFVGAFYVVQAAARQMSVQDPPGGSIIGISSASALVGAAGQTHYTPTKAGVLNLMQSTACALGKYNIRCNALLPGTIRTQMNDDDLSDPDNEAHVTGRIPLGRLGEPTDVAGPAIFLASDMSAYVTGAQLLVDGGMFVNMQ